MKFKKLSLDEALFDEPQFIADTPRSEGSWFEFDDDFSEPEYTPQNAIPTGPLSATSNGIADTIMSLINDEWEAVKGYNNFVEQLQYNINLDGDASLKMMLPVIDDIRNEENKHVGQLQELLKLISPNAQSIEDGARESHEQFRFVDGKLPVQAMTPPNPGSVIPNEVSTDCTILDIDDEM